MWVGIEQLHLSKLVAQRPTLAVSSVLIDLVREFGPLVPVCVRPSGPRCYEILTNAETWFAAQRAGHHQVPITIHTDLSDEDVQRILSYDHQDDPISEAKRFHAEIEPAGATRRQHGAIVALAAREERSASYVAHALRLLQLPEIVQEAIRIGALKVGHGKVLLRTSAEEQLQLATRIITERWSVRKSESHVRHQLRQPPPIDIRRLERRLSALIGSPAEIDLASGELRIRYGGSLDVLDGLLQRLGYIETDL